jgi:hypothetical protein
MPTILLPESACCRTRFQPEYTSGFCQQTVGDRAPGDRPRRLEKTTRNRGPCASTSYYLNGIVKEFFGIFKVTGSKSHCGCSVGLGVFFFA